ncbi:uncharacterized protein LOC120338753 isoform X2 [Styela clava]
MISTYVYTTTFWIISCMLGLSTILLLMLCMKKKKRYVKNEDFDNNVTAPDQRSRTSTNGDGVFDRQTEQRLSQHSVPNEHRILPEIPKNAGNGKTNGSPPTPEQSVTPGAVSLDETQRHSNPSPKKSRRLPALPPAGNVEVVQTIEGASNEKDIEATYEDLRDDTVEQPDPSNEVIGSGDSSLYAKVPEDLSKQHEDDTDLYAQVGAGDDDAKAELKKTKNSPQKSSSTSSSEDDKLMDSPTAVTYASVDKMKKTMSVKRTKKESTSSLTAPPPVPDRNFDEEDEASSSTSAEQHPHPAPTPQPEVNSTQDALSSKDGNEQTGPAYDTVSVRESFAHQRLRQMVEDERRNRYINTNMANSNGRVNNQPDVYSQIDDENTEAVYESVSAPGSADGTIGVTGHNLQSQNNHQSTREDGYISIDTTLTGETGVPLAPPSPAVPQEVSPDYENIDPEPR